MGKRGRKAVVAAKCMFPECGNDGLSRGLCRSHYQTARNLVKAEETTWAALEKAGKALASRTAHGVRSWFLEKKES